MEQKSERVKSRSQTKAVSTQCDSNFSSDVFRGGARGMEPKGCWFPILASITVLYILYSSYPGNGINYFLFSHCVCVLSLRDTLRPSLPPPHKTSSLLFHFSCAIFISLSYFFRFCYPYFVVFSSH